MVRIGSGDYGNIRAQAMERAVELVGLDNAEGGVGAQKKVRSIVAEHSAEKGVRACSLNGEGVGRHRRRGRFSVGSREADRFRRGRDESEHFRTLHYCEAIAAEPAQPAMAFGHGGGEDNESVGRIAEPLRNKRVIVVEDNVDSFGLKGFGQARRSAVISGHTDAPAVEIAFESRHSYAAGSDEINVLYIFVADAHFPIISLILSIIFSSAPRSAISPQCFEMLSRRARSARSSATVGPS